MNTDVLVDLERGGCPEEVDARLGDEARAIGVSTVSELLHGGLRSTGATWTRGAAGA